MFENYKSKDSVVVVYTGEGKGKTSASVGLLGRALGNGWKVAFVQFIKHWEVGEHHFFRAIQEVYPNELVFIKGGKGFYDAGELSAKDVTEKEHKQAARDTLKQAIELAGSGEYELVICDEINNAVHDKLLEEKDLERLFESRHEKTSLCVTGRNFPEAFLKYADIATNMDKIKHHFDEKYLANKGIDY